MGNVVLLSWRCGGGKVIPTAAVTKPALAQDGRIAQCSRKRAKDCETRTRDYADIQTQVSCICIPKAWIMRATKYAARIHAEQVGQSNPKEQHTKIKMINEHMNHCLIKITVKCIGRPYVYPEFSTRSINSEDLGQVLKWFTPSDNLSPRFRKCLMIPSTFHSNY
jgi:hypothetical protein